MTRALYELLDRAPEQNGINDPDTVDQLGREIRYTAEEVRTHQASPEVVDKLVEAVQMLTHTEAPEYQKLLPAAEAAAVTHNPELHAVVGELLEETFPISDSAHQDPAVYQANRIMQREYITAIHMTSEDLPFPMALSRAALISEGIIGQDYDELLQLNDEIVRQSIRDNKIKAEREKLDGEPDDFDDAVPMDPSELFDDDDDKSAFEKKIEEKYQGKIAA